MENRAYGSIIGSANAPYLNGLARRYGLATNYTAIAHPSEPNYLALFGGSTFGVVDDGVHNISGPNLADQLEAHGLTWRVAAENVPTHCYTGATAYGGTDGAGWYARKHEPAISFLDISSNPARCRNIQNLSSFRPGAATVQFVIPNFCHDMHDCSTATGDAFLRAWLPRLLTSPTFSQTLLLITWDEGTDGTGGGGRVATLVVSPSVRAGTQMAGRMNHYSILRTIETLWSLGCLRKSCLAGDLLAAVHPPSATH
jgi:phosphatidylinositol-3-phosphatase